MRPVHVALLVLLAGCFPSVEVKGCGPENFPDGGICLFCPEPDMAHDQGVPVPPDLSMPVDMTDSDAIFSDAGTD
jgi:hypothetical protein